VRLEELGQLKNPMISSGIEPATIQFLAYCLDHLRYFVPSMGVTQVDLNLGHKHYSQLARSISSSQRENGILIAVCT
jgi:hypothetical protein